MTASKKTPAAKTVNRKAVDHSASNKIISDAIAKGDLTLPKAPPVKTLEPVKTMADAVARAKELAANAPKAAPKAKAETKAKTVRKGAEKKASTPKAATKPAKEAIAFVARTVKAGTPVHAIAEDARPGSGARLFAHTHAALTMLGMLAEGRPVVPQSSVLTIMGQRAVTYHKKQMNFEDAPNHGLRLSITGRNAFLNRFREGKVSNSLANDFLALLIDGKAAASTGVAQTKVYQTKV